MGPFGPLDALVPAAGRILDWGAGHGVGTLSMALQHPARQVTATDISPARLAALDRAAARAGLGDRVVTEVVGPADLPRGAWDAIVLDDVLYLLDPAARDRLVVAAARALAPGGVLICKEMAARPTWKRRLADAQERLVVDRLGITDSTGGAHPFPDPAALGAQMAAAGLAVDQVRLDRHRHVPHLAVVGRR